MKVSDWLKQTTGTLNKAGIGTARLDALVILEGATGKDRSWLLAHPDYDVKGQSFHKLMKQVEKRCQHIPLAQIRGKTEFYGREFIINEHVLEPRPESETMINLLKEVVDSQQSSVTRKKKTGDIRLDTGDYNLKIVDVGTGSGALAITAKLEFPDTKVVATDIDPKCLSVAKKNTKKYGLDIKFYRGDLLEALPDSLLSASDTVVLANLPYVPDSHTVNQAALNEPKIAIFGGPDGLDVYRRLFRQIATKSQFFGVECVLAESLPFQHKELAKIALKAGYRLTKTDDFMQLYAS